ncbi:MAG: exosortase N, partial [Chitinophagaceae bacterium]|nr:exosortase N [Chitinophagaceae bacterium]
QSLKIKLPNTSMGVYSWPLLYLLLLGVSLHDYIPWGEPNFWLGITALAGVITSSTHKQANNRFAYAALGFLVLYLALPAATFLFFILLCGFLYAVEVIKGRLPATVWVILFLMSPVANYAAEIFAFPIRLWLSDGVGWFFKKLDADLQIEGNRIWFGGIPFDVEDACMGLDMLVSSLLVGHAGLLMLEKKHQRRMPAVWLPLVYVLFFGLNVLANYIRIICLVYFRVMPETISHEIVGLCCWILYGLVPGFWLLKHLLLQVGHFEPVGLAEARSSLRKPPLYHLLQVALLLATTLVLPLRHQQPVHDEVAPQQLPYLQNFTGKPLKHGVMSFSKPHQLIYLKQVKGFYSTDHNPSICWRGSGYKFTRIRNRKNATIQYYSATLEKSGQALYTAWWYECGNLSTNKQLAWRMHNFLTGQKCRLVNITSDSAEGLQLAIDNWLKNR